MIAQWIYRHLGEDIWNDGCSHPPGTGLFFRYWREVHPKGALGCSAHLTNDGFEVMLNQCERDARGEVYDWETRLTLRPREIMAIAWFLLWRYYIIGTGLGVRRWLWYQALRRIVEGHRRRVEQQAKTND